MPEDKIMQDDNYAKGNDRNQYPVQQGDFQIVSNEPREKDIRDKCGDFIRNEEVGHHQDDANDNDCFVYSHVYISRLYYLQPESVDWGMGE
jgi:hypothetical protein